MCIPRWPSPTRAALESEPLNPGPQTLGRLCCWSLRIGGEEEGSLQEREGNVKAITEESLYSLPRSSGTFVPLSSSRGGRK